MMVVAKAECLTRSLLLPVLYHEQAKHSFDLANINSLLRAPKDLLIGLVSDSTSKRVGNIAHPYVSRNSH